MKNETHEEVEEKKYFRKLVISLLFIIILVLFVIGISFSTYIKMEQVKDSAVDTVENVSMKYTESNNGISIENASPINDDVGKLLKAPGEYFDFTVTTKIVQNTPVYYEIAAVKDATSTLKDNEVKIYLEKQVSGTYEQILAPQNFIPITEKTTIGSPSGSMVLLKVKKKTSGTDNYRLRMWVDEKTNIDAVKKYSIKINVYGKIL